MNKRTPVPPVLTNFFRKVYQVSVVRATIEVSSLVVFDRRILDSFVRQEEILDQTTNTLSASR